MRYYIDLFSPETANAFSNSNKTISGFRKSRKTYIENQNIASGDKFICYCIRIQRFIGILEIKSSFFEDDTPIFTEADDPFTLRFKVNPLIWLPLEKSVPIHNPLIWNHLSFTKDLPQDSKKWTFMVFSSPRLWPEDDCKYIEQILLKQNEEQREYPFSEKDKKNLKSSKIRISSTKETSVTIPDNEEENTHENDIEQRDSIKIQSTLGEIGEKLGFKVWIPMIDRSRVLHFWNPGNEVLLDELPLVFEENTLKTIRNIDVLWIKRRSIIRCFEVEDTTSIYSGILRMADLIALQPMLDIKIHIVAPDNRRDSVFQQITRPVFAVMEKGPLAEICSYISYDSINELSNERNLQHMTDTIIDEYSEFAEDQ